MQRLDFRIDLLRWLRGDVILSQMRVDRPDLLLEQDAKGRANWVFPAGEAEWPTIRQLAVSQGRVRYRNVRRRTDLDFDVRSGDVLEPVQRLEPALCLACLAGLGAEALYQSFVLADIILLVLKSFLLQFKPDGFFFFIEIKVALKRYSGTGKDISEKSGH